MKPRAARLTAALLACLTVAACSDRGGGASRIGEVREERLTDSATMMGWIGNVTAQSIRRPGYAADGWTAADTLEMIHEPSLVPLTRAAVRIVEGLRGQTADGGRPARADLCPTSHGADPALRGAELNLGTFRARIDRRSS